MLDSHEFDWDYDPENPESYEAKMIWDGEGDYRRWEVWVEENWEKFVNENE